MLDIRYDAATDVVVISDDESPWRRATKQFLRQGGLFTAITLLIWAIFLFGSTPAAAALAGPTGPIVVIILVVPIGIVALLARRAFRENTRHSDIIMIFTQDGLSLSWLGNDPPFLPWDDISEAVLVDTRRRWLKALSGTWGRHRYLDVVLVVRPDWAQRLVPRLPRLSRRFEPGKYLLIGLRRALEWSEQPTQKRALRLGAADLVWLFGRYIPIHELPDGYRPQHEVLKTLSPRRSAWLRLPASQNGMH